MAYGPIPKDDGEAVHRNPRVHERMNLEWDGVIRGPELPRVSGVRWCARTRKWWHMWRTSPQSMIMVDTDWEVMLEAALLHNTLWSNKATRMVRVGNNWEMKEVMLSPADRAALSAELRRKLAPYGSTYEDRAKLRLSVKSPADERSEEQVIQTEAKKAVSYMERLALEAAEQT